MQENKVILYHANWSLCSQMVRVALYEKNIPFESKHIKLCDQYQEGENIDKKFLQINPLGTVPAIKINGDVTCNSEEIIKKLNDISSDSDIDLYSVVDDESNSLIKETTITEGVKFASTIGTIMPVFSAPLIQHMVKKLPVKSILKILFKHPRRDRKYFFVGMYLFNFSKNLPKISVNKFVDELIRFENYLLKENLYFYKNFSHIDINMMCLFNRLNDLKLIECLNTSKTPLMKNYWKNLQERESYKNCILDYYTEKEINVIDEFYQNKQSPFLDLILNELQKRN